jgi:Protein of unknown function (DUF4058)
MNMPSPFPGMDPYLEAPETWNDFHHELMSSIREMLNKALRPNYHAMVEERVYISDEADPGRKWIIPDVHVTRRKDSTNLDRVSAPSSDYDSVTSVAEPVVITTLIDDEIHEARLAIYDAKTREVVTIIEVLSPTNKIAGSRGRASYASKRSDVLDSRTNFVEIDLLRSGVPFFPREMLPPLDYAVHVSKFGQRPKGIVWPILLKQRLPKIQIPLRPADKDVEIDLGLVLNTAYDRAGYDMIIDYSQPPFVPLEDANATWAKEWLKRHPPTPVHASA